jgi:hypothetical protein
MRWSPRERLKLDRLACPRVCARFISPAALILCIAYGAIAFGGPPLQTDDPDTPGPGNWEINVATELEKSRDEWAWTPLLDINYGAGERVQLKVKPRYAIRDEPDRPERSGAGNIQFGVKWRFLDMPDGLAISIYPQVDVNPPGRSIRRGLVDDGADFILPVQVAHNFGNTRLYGEVGFVWREHRRDGFLYGLAFEHPLDARFRWTGEIRGASEVDLDDSELLFNFGFKARVAEHLTLLASAGRTFREAPEGRAATYSYVGLQFTF